MARVKMAEKKEKPIHTRKRDQRERRKKLLELGKMECCCDLKCRSLKKTVKKITNLKNLPEEIILEIASYFSLKDLLVFGQVSKYFHQIIENASATWAKVSFQNIWPNRKNIACLERAAECGNIECLAKLSFVSLYIYNFKTKMRKCMKTSLENAEKAIKYFTKIDELIQPHVPLTWMFIRPPWAYPGGERKCLKECLLLNLEEQCQTDEASIPSLYNVGKTYLLKDDDVDNKAIEYFTKAMKKGCANSKYEIYKQQKANCRNDDPGVKLEAIRNLQEIATQRHTRAIVELCLNYADGEFGSGTKQNATDFVRKVMTSCKPSGIHRIASSEFKKINDLMRCILINWMQEVCDVKNIKSEALHMAIDCLDRYLLKRSIQRKQLQLTGISCVVLASKAFSFNSSNLLTIRESAWLTDSTYEYNEVVKMLAEVIGALNGKLVRMNVSHYTEILCAFAKLDTYNVYFTYYIVDSSLQFCEFGRYKPSLIAAAAIFLTNIISKTGDVWSETMVQFTGFEVKHLANCAALLHKECLLSDSVVTDGENRISGARDRYSSPEFLEVSKRQIPDIATIRACIEDVEPRLRSEVVLTRTGDLLVFYFKEERNILDPGSNISVNSSFLFGYDGDEEDNLDQNHSVDDLSFFCGKEQHAEPTNESMSKCTQNNESSLNSATEKHYVLDYDSGSDETRPGTDNCICKPKSFDLDAKNNIETSMEMLSEVFSTACSCSSSSNKSNSPEKSNEKNAKPTADYFEERDHDVKDINSNSKKQHAVKKESRMNLRSTSKMKLDGCKSQALDSTDAPSENADRNDRRKRRANWSVSSQAERSTVNRVLRPRLDRKNYKKEPWRY